MARHSVSVNTRNHVFDMDSFTCHYCSAILDDNDITVDHIVPRAVGGPDGRWNLVTACKRCNSRYGNVLNKCQCSRCDLALQMFLNGVKRGIPQGPGRRPVLKPSPTVEPVVERLNERIAEYEARIEAAPNKEATNVIGWMGKCKAYRECLVLLTSIGEELTERAS